MKLSIFICSTSLLFLSSCYTMLEGANPYAGNSNQQYTTNAAGERVLKYDRYAPLNLGVPLAIGSQLTDSAKPNSYGSTYPQNNETAKREGVSRGFFEVSSSSEDLHLGFHAGWQITTQFETRLGASAIFSRDPYLGLDLSGRYFVSDTRISPFVGAGGFVGDARSCDRGSSGVEQCEKKFLGLGYLELGTSFGPLSVFYRSYSMNRAGISIPARDFLGIGIMF